MNNPLPHVALSLLELSNLLQQGRVFLPIWRFQFVDSSSVETVNDYRPQVLEMFSGLPAIDLKEDQSYFVARTSSASSTAFHNSLSPSIEIAVSSIDRLFPVTQQGRETFLATRRLPGVVIHGPIFESIWDDYFWERHALVSLMTALELANEFVAITSPVRHSKEWERFINLTICNESRKDIRQLDDFARLLQHSLRHRRDPLKNNYQDRTAVSVFADLFACVFNTITAEDLKIECRDFYRDQAKTSSQGLCDFIETDDFQHIASALQRVFDVPGNSYFSGVALFLYIQLRKQNGDFRSLGDLAHLLLAQPGFDRESIALAVTLVGLSEPSDAVTGFIYGRKGASYGLLSFTPTPLLSSDNSRLIPDIYFSPRVEINQPPRDEPITSPTEANESASSTPFGNRVSAVSSSLSTSTASPKANDPLEVLPTLKVTAVSDDAALESGDSSKAAKAKPAKTTESPKKTKKTPPASSPDLVDQSQSRNDGDVKPFDAS